MNRDDIEKASKKIHLLDELHAKFREAMTSRDHDEARLLARETKSTMDWLNDFYDRILQKDDD